MNVQEVLKISKERKIKNKDSMRDILFYYFDGRINNGRYYAKRVDNNLILNK